MDSFDYKKSLGQNFLKDSNITKKIARSVSLKRNNLVIEIGPGSGVLSKEILKRADFAILYEIDTRLKEVLEEELRDYDNYDIVFKDFLDVDVKKDLEKYDYGNLYVVANLPYYVTTPIIRKIIDDKIDVEEIVIMIQKEVADRFSALPGNKEYGQITVFLNYFFETVKLFDVSRNSFVPKPNVDSAVIKMKKRMDKVEVLDMDLFEKLVRDSFRFKRKTIRNNLKGYDLDKINIVLNRHGFDLSTRSECLPYNVFVEIVNELVR